MSDSTTLTLRLNADLKDKLGRLSNYTQRSKSYHAAEALAAYVERELEIIEGIRAGLEDMRTGNTLSHQDAMAEIDELIEAVAAKRPVK